MNYYPDSALHKLGFHDVKEALASRCLTALGRAEALALLPCSDATQLTALLGQADEAQRLLEQGYALPVESLPLMETIWAQAGVEGMFLEPLAWLQVARLLKLANSLAVFIRSREADLPALQALLSGYVIDASFVKRIERAISPEGQVRPDASAELVRIRRQQADTAAQVRKTLGRVMATATENAWTDAQELTLRNDRLVVPLKAHYKGKVPGFVHDVSATGQTIYLEPVEALEGNNRLRELGIEERHEIERILVGLTNELRPHLPALRQMEEWVTRLDLVQARAALAQAMGGGTVPLLVPPERGLRIVAGRNPQLLLRHKPADVVPMDVNLAPPHRVLVISGPNAGGKSVALKTIGLMSCMAQCGLLVPAATGTRIPVFTHLWVDVGDEQSVQNDLSAYSSHLRLMAHLLQNATANGLFLLDELGSGTDPLFGGPIAEAMLECLAESGATGVATTHYSNLKEFAETHAHTLNAAMEFHRQDLRPTFRLLLEQPGSSFAFEIAERVGVPADVLALARAKMSSPRMAVEVLLAQLQDRAREVTEHQQRLVALEDKLKAQREELRNRRDKQDEALALRYEQAERELDRLAREARSRIDAAVEAVRKSEAEKLATQNERAEVAQTLTQAVASIQRLKPKRKKRPLATLPGSLAVGDAVRLIGGTANGTVVSVEGEKARVVFGSMEMTVKATELQRVQAPKQIKVHEVKLAHRLRAAKAETATQSLDLRGKRVEEALPLLDKFVDDAQLAGFEQLTILHGKGTGALRDAIRGHLRRTYPSIRKIAPGPEDGGGEGITLITLG